MVELEEEITVDYTKFMEAQDDAFLKLTDEMKAGTPAENEKRLEAFNKQTEEFRVEFARSYRMDIIENQVKDLLARHGFTLEMFSVVHHQGKSRTVCFNDEVTGVGIAGQAMRSGIAMQVWKQVLEKM